SSFYEPKRLEGNSSPGEISEERRASSWHPPCFQMAARLTKISETLQFPAGIRPVKMRSVSNRINRTKPNQSTHVPISGALSIQESERAPLNPSQTRLHSEINV